MENAGSSPIHAASPSPARAAATLTEFPEFGKGAWEALATGDAAVLALRFVEGKETVIAVHNLASEPRRVRPRGARRGRKRLVEVFADRRYGDPSSSIELDGYGYRWLRAEY